jgi:hypothetical protein
MSDDLSYLHTPALGPAGLAQLRAELAKWRELHDKRLAERDEHVETIVALRARVAELEEQERNAGKLAVAHLEASIDLRAKLERVEALCVRGDWSLVDGIELKEALR